MNINFDLHQVVHQSRCASSDAFCLGDDALSYLNRVRESRGLQAFKSAPRLQRLAVDFILSPASSLDTPLGTPPIPEGQRITRSASGQGTDPVQVRRGFAPTVAINNLLRDDGTRGILLFQADAAGIAVAVKGDSYSVAIYIGEETIAPPPNFSIEIPAARS